MKCLPMILDRVNAVWYKCLIINNRVYMYSEREVSVFEEFDDYSITANGRVKFTLESYGEDADGNRGEQRVYAELVSVVFEVSRKDESIMIWDILTLKTRERLKRELLDSAEPE